MGCAEKGSDIRMYTSSHIYKYASHYVVFGVDHVLSLVMPTAQLASCRLLGWAVIGPARAGKSAPAQSQLGLARANRIPPKKSVRGGPLKMSQNT